MTRAQCQKGRKAREARASPKPPLTAEPSPACLISLNRPPQKPWRAGEALAWRGVWGVGVWACGCRARRVRTQRGCVLSGVGGARSPADRERASASLAAAAEDGSTCTERNVGGNGNENGSNHHHQHHHQNDAEALPLRVLWPEGAEIAGSAAAALSTITAGLPTHTTITRLNSSSVSSFTPPCSERTTRSAQLSLKSGIEANTLCTGYSMTKQSRANMCANRLWAPASWEPRGAR